MTTYTELWNTLRALYEARNEPENIRPLADIYWRLMLSCGLLLIVIAIGWGVWVFVAALSDLSSASPDTSSRPAALDRNQLQAVLAAYQARGQALTAEESQTTHIADPSQ